MKIVGSYFHGKGVIATFLKHFKRGWYVGKSNVLLLISHTNHNEKLEWFHSLKSRRKKCKLWILHLICDWLPPPEIPWGDQPRPEATLRSPLIHWYRLDHLKEVKKILKTRRRLKNIHLSLKTRNSRRVHITQKGNLSQYIWIIDTDRKKVRG